MLYQVACAHNGGDKAGSYEYSNHGAPTNKAPYPATLGSNRRGVKISGEVAGTIVYLRSVGSVGGGRVGDGRVDMFMPALDTGGSGRGKCGKEGKEEEDGNGERRHGARHREWLGEWGSWGWILGQTKMKARAFIVRENLTQSFVRHFFLQMKSRGLRKVHWKKKILGCGAICCRHVFEFGNERTRNSHLDNE